MGQKRSLFALLSIFVILAGTLRVSNFYNRQLAYSSTTNILGAQFVQQKTGGAVEEEPADKNNNSKLTGTLSLMESTTNNSTNSSTNTNTTTARTIPRTIYIFWKSGWPANKLTAQLARKSWEYFNSGNNGYTVHALDYHQAELLTDRRRYVPDLVFEKMKVQAQSDVYRTLLLYRHGGIWVDASLFCNMPLDDWLDLNQTDLITFVRNDNLGEQKGKDIYPWITSWFLAAPKESFMLSQIVNILSNATGEQEHRLNKPGDYFWWHRIVSDLARQDEYIMNRIQTLFRIADPMHCKQEGYESMAPVLKRCGNDKMYSTFATAHVCCTAGRHGSGSSSSSSFFAQQPPNSSRDSTIQMAQATANLTQKPMTAEAWNDFCAGWNCTMHSRNMHRVDELKALYGNKTFDKLPVILYSG